MRLDAIFENGRFRTLSPGRPTATRVGVLGGRIVGFDEELDGVTAAEVHDLGGAPVLPGFHDAHYHLSMTGARLAQLNLRPSNVSTLDDLYREVAERAQTLPPNAWVRGSGYDQNVTGAHPSADALDKAAGGRPVLLEHVSGHMVVVNNAAFALAGFPGGVGVPDVPGGSVARDESGRATGLLQERAMELVYPLVKPISAEDLLHHIDLASDQAIRYGLTSVTEPGLGDYRMIGSTPVDLGIFQDAVESGVLRTRMTAMPYCTTLHAIEGWDGWRGLDLGIRTGLGDDRFRIGPVKIVSDGSFIGRSAAMHHCYHGEPHNHGVLQFDPEEIAAMVVEAHRAGWSVAAHAIGDAAIDHVMDAFAQAQKDTPRPDVRHRIEHFGLTSDSQVARAAALGLTPVPQGTFISDFGDGMRAAVEPEFENQIYRMKSLLDAGIVVPGSTDSPVSDGNPLVSIHDMVNRTTASGHVLGPDERLTVDEAVRAYTYGSAYAVGQEDRKGVLAHGMLADFVALSDDLYEIDVTKIRDVSVVQTVVDGKVEFQAD
ncbi:amidohydrolase [Prescottella defluvii]|nr:amidohydrolase [Prescottella defluvii]